MSFPVLETDRLKLRPFTNDDIDGLHQMWTEPAMRKYLWDDQVIPHETVVEVVQASLNSFAEHGFGYWTVSFKNQLGLIGFCGLRHFHESDAGDEQVEVMYGVNYEYCGKGLATEAAQAMLKYGFDQIGLERIYAGADPPNKVSFRVMERIGMTLSHHAKIGELDAIYYKIHRLDFHPETAVVRVLDSRAD